MNQSKNRSDQRDNELSDFLEFLKKLKENGWTGFKRYELVGTYAEKIGSFFAKKDKRTQIRWFFDEINAIRARQEAKHNKSNMSLEDLLANLYRLKALAAYKSARNSFEKQVISEDFKRFIFASIDQIKEEKDFEIFSEFFEAMYAYFYSLAKQ